MSDFSIKHLIDFSELSRATSWVLSSCSQNESMIKSCISKQESTETSLTDLKSQLNDHATMINDFSIGLQTLHKIEDKLNSWSERFTSIEEKAFSMNSGLERLKNKVESEVERLDRERREQTLWFQDYLDKELDRKVKNSIAGLSAQVSEMMSEIQVLKSDVDSPVPIAEKENKQTEEVSSEPKRETSTNLEEISKSLVRSSSFLGINSRISRIESQLHDCLSELEDQRALKEEKAKNKQISPETDILTIKYEVEKIFKKSLNDLKEYKAFFDSIQYDPITPKPETSSFSKKIERFESMNIVNEVKSLKSKLETMESTLEELPLKDDLDFLAKTNELIIQRSVKNQLAIEEQKISSNLEELTQSINQIRLNLASSDGSVGKLTNDLDKIHKLTPHFLVRSELDDILLKFSRKIKDPRKNYVEPEDYGPKIFEQEQRINKLWRSHNNSLDIIQKIEEKITGIEKALLQLQENKSINVEFKISTLESALSDQIKEVKESFKLFENIPELVPYENEMYFRSMILELRTEIASIKDELSKPKPKQADPLPLSSVNFEEIQEPIQFSLLQSILKQHDTAIRMLANKSIPQQAEEKNKEHFVELDRLEELKKEMKDMIAKKEENQRLSQKEMEIVQKISEAVEGKVGKEELTQMAEKDDLKRIYRLLKKRIDSVAEAVKKKQEANREEPYFMKKGYNIECASCGRVTSAKLEEKQVGEYAKFMGSKSPPGVGFSKLLRSLIPNSRGGHVLPHKSSYGQLEPITSPKTYRPMKKKC